MTFIESPSQDSNPSAAPSPLENIKGDLITYSRLGKAFWVNPQDSRRTTLDTLSITTLLNLNPERTLEKASAALLERAKALSPGGQGRGLRGSSGGALGGGALGTTAGSL